MNRCAAKLKFFEIVPGKFNVLRLILMASKPTNPWFLLLLTPLEIWFVISLEELYKKRF